MILERLIPSRRSSIENPSVPLSSVDTDSPLWDAMTGGATASSGVSVNVRSGLTYSAVWRGVNLISQAIAKTPLQVFRNVDGGKELDRTHPAYKLLKRKPSQYYTSLVFKQTLVAHALFTGRGNGYARIVRDGAGRPVELLIMDPSRTYPVRYGGVLWYMNETDGAGLRKLRPEDVIHIKGFGYDGLVGYDIVTYMRETLGLGLAIRKFGSIFFRNGAAPNVVLERPAEAPALSKEAERNVRDSFDKIHGGDSVHRTALLQEGMKASVLGIDAQKSQLIELRQFEIREVANFLGLPPHKVGDIQSRAYASLEQENQSFNDDAVDGWFCSIEAELNEKMLSEEEKENETHVIEFNRESLVRVNFEAKVNGLVNQINNGLMLLDEGRNKLNMPPYPNGLGQMIRRPANITEVDLSGTPDVTPAAEPVVNDPASPEVNASPAPSDETVNIVEQMNAYGIGVRAGVITPQRDDEDVVRTLLDLPAPSADVARAWSQSGGVRAPITLKVQGDGSTPASPPADSGFQVGAPPPEPADGRAERIHQAHERALSDVLKRMIRRIAKQAEQAARKPDSFVSWIETDLRENASVWRESVGPIWDAMTANGELAIDIAQACDAFFEAVSTGLLSACECKAAELPDAVARWAGEAEHVIAKTYQESDNGTQIH
jgi:HK97 family phage portal protein